MVFKEGIFNGKVIVVTGGGSGIGKVITEEFVKLGGEVAIIGRKIEKLKSTADEIKEKYGKDIFYLGDIDVRVEEKVEFAFDEIKKRFGRVDVLVNNAGANFLSPTEELSLKGWNAVVGTVLGGTFLCSKYAVRIMKENGGGVIINISATTGIFGSPFATHSAASKAGLEGWTKAVAVEWARYKIRVNNVSPGLVRTEGFVENVKLPEDVFERVEKATPIGRLPTPRDIAYAVVFLASPAAEAICGATLIVDGGHWFAKGLIYP